jgi:regulatory protein
MADSSDPYIAALQMLGRRELSEAQVRDRLARRGHTADAIDDAVGRLRDQGAIDDVRAAESIVRTETSVRRRGKLRVDMQLERAGIASTTARRAVEEAFATLDEAAQIEAAIGRRLRGRSIIADEHEFQRLYRFLVGQGFDPDRILAVLTRRRSRT